MLPAPRPAHARLTALLLLAPAFYGGQSIYIIFRGGACCLAGGYNVAVALNRILNRKAAKAALAANTRPRRAARALPPTEGLGVQPCQSDLQLRAAPRLVCTDRDPVTLRHPAQGVSAPAEVRVGNTQRSGARQLRGCLPSRVPDPGLGSGRGGAGGGSNPLSRGYPAPRATRDERGFDSIGLEWAREAKA